MVIYVTGKAMEKILTGLAGEYHVAAELCRRGFFASLTLKNGETGHALLRSTEQPCVARREIHHRDTWGHVPMRPN